MTSKMTSEKRAEEISKLKADPRDGLRLLELTYAGNVCQTFSCGGLLKDVPKEQLVLFYRGGEKGAAGCIELPGTPKELEGLLAACSPMRRGNAQKLNVGDFSIGFSPERIGLVKTVRAELLVRSGLDDRRIGVELCELNVYAEGASWGPYKSSRAVVETGGKEVVGLLMVGLPAAHTGGALVVKERDQEMKHDWSDAGSNRTVRWAAWSTTSKSTKHEIEKVTSGHMISLTYNLFIEEEEKVEDPWPKFVEEIPESNVRENSFFQELSNQLRRKEFYPGGGTLGFDLHLKYPFFEKGSESSVDLNTKIHYLKSTDNLFRAIGTTLGLKVELKVVYDILDSYTLMTSIFQPSDEVWDQEDDFTSGDCEVIADDGGWWEGDARWPRKVDWMVKLPCKNSATISRFNRGQDYQDNYVTELTAECVMIMRVPPFLERTRLADSGNSSGVMKQLFVGKGISGGDEC